MKKSTSLFTSMVLVVLVVVAVVFTARKDPVPKSVTRPTLDSIINVHGSPEQGLRICGRTFRRVKGGPPYFIPVPAMPLVLLAYEPSPGNKTLVVCNTNDCTFQEIPLGEIAFGNQIGVWDATKGQMGDIVDSVTSNRLSLLHKGFRYVERSMLDLNDGSIRVLEVQSDLRPSIVLDFWTNQMPQAPNEK